MILGQKIVIPAKPLITLETKPEKMSREEIREVLRANLSLRIQIGSWDWEE